MLTIGLAIGAGTGPELAEVFKKTIAALAAARGVEAGLHASPRLYRSYGAGFADAAEAARTAREDAASYEAFLLELAGRACPAVFRTAFNAEAIYLVRERLRAVKLEVLPLPEGELLLVRDEAQGFYAGRNDDPAASPDSIARSCEFRRDVTQRVLDYALRTATERWGGRIDRTLMVYKFHVLDGRFASWVEEHARRRGARVELVQPDTMNRNILRGGLRGNVLVVGANEWLDVMHADLLARFGGGAQEERFSRNVHLEGPASAVVEYQTVHGSADDIAGQGVVNPIATMRAAADILARHGACAGLAAELETAIERARRGGAATPDVGGTSVTASVVDAILREFAAGRASSRA